MGFFSVEELNPQTLNQSLKGHSIEFLHKHQCQVCPLNNQRGLCNPHMPATGTKHPLVYMIGEAPGQTEDEKGRQFVGRAGKVLRMRIPEDWLPDIRWNNCVRTRPPKNRTPTAVEIECCRPSIIADIEKSKPAAILGFGAVPLDWALKEKRITNWAGRRVPVKIGTHSCWFYPMVHPSWIMRGRKFEPRSPRQYGSDWEFAFATHVKRALREVDYGLPKPRVITDEEAEANLTWVVGKKGDLEKVRAFFKRAWNVDYVGFDYETKGLRPYEKNARILTAAISTADENFAFPLNHREGQWSDAELDELYDLLEDFLINAPCVKVSHRLAFEAEWSRRFFGRASILKGKWEDTESQAYVLDERKGTHSLNFLCMQHFGLHVKELSRVDRKNLDKVPLEIVLRYNAIDSKFHRLLFFKQRNLLKTEGLQWVYRQHLPRVIAQVMTQARGVPVDQVQVRKFATRYEKETAEVERDIAKLSIVKQFKKEFGIDFSPSSNPHVKKALTKLARLQVEKVDEDALTKVRHPLAKLIVKWRKPQKLLSTYIYPIMKGSPHIYPDGRLHPIINTTRTRTWRTSSEDPNIQNFPKRGPNKIIRRQIRSGDPDIRVVTFDYAGIQARIVGAESLDPKLIKVYWEHYDIHSDWTRRIARHVPNWVFRDQMRDKDKFKELRSRVKNKFVFPSFFGSQAKSVANDLKITENQAQRVQDEFFDKEFRKVKVWHKEQIKFYETHGYITGLSKFRRRAPISINELINSPIQSDESLIVCNAQARLAQYGEPRFDANMEIHDDLTFFWPKRDIEKNSEIVLNEMLYVEFDWMTVIPWEVEMSVGENWCDIKEVGKFESVGRDRWKQLGT